MSCRHVDIVAIAVLLLGMALVSASRHTVPVIIAHKRITLTEQFHRPLVAAPRPPRIPLTFD